MDIADYLSEITEIYKSGDATEHSYRAPLQRLFESVDDSARVINEPKRSEGGMPDFLFQRNGVAFGWAEAKDIDKDVIKLKGYSVEQRKRYENAYPNLLYTNGVDFEFIRNKEVVHRTSIADFLGDLGGLQPLPEKLDELERQLKLFVEQKPISIRSAQKLAEMMAGKAAIIKDEVGIALAEDAEFRSGLGRQYNTFKDNLLPNLTPGEFADIYAETITYGMFAARLHDDTLETFSRQEALEKLPKSNPFLRGLFQYVAGYDIPDRLRYVVDDLAEVLRASDPHSLFEDFGKFTARNDPFIHFYETFLAAYNPKKRKSRGVWYTPEPVVDFIVRAVDDVLKTEFGIADGLADTGKVTVDWDTGQTDKKAKPVTIRKDVHRVQILDPATGTGTFLAKTVQTIADRVKARAPGKWSSYVEEDLLPRLHGFELLMASYAMCHMKLDMQLTESGYVPSKNPPRLSVWLTNALEPAEREVKDLFFQQLADEARGASEVKRQTPIMCVIGNPPYSGESANKGDHIMGLMEAYKTEPGGKERLKERNPKWVNDDYVKFIRMSEDLIAKNPSGGVLGFITNHGYLDNPTFRGMRWHLLKTFDKIWVLDLHGNAKKKEVSPDGSPDKNVFDIQQGVALIVAVRKDAGSDELAEVWHGDLWGSRKAKSEALREPPRESFSLVDTREPRFEFGEVDHELEARFRAGFGLENLLPVNSIGIVTGADWKLVSSAKSPEIDRQAIGETYEAELEQGFSYRPFEAAKLYYDRRLIERDRYDVMRHYTSMPNIGILTTKAHRDQDFAHAFLTTKLSEAIFLSGTTASNAMNLPLYLYPEEDAAQADALAPTERTLNLDPKLYRKICKAAGIDPDDIAGPQDDFRAPTGDARPPEIKVFDYIYGVLHSPDYRRTFAELLKIDFPRIPFPASPEVFQHVSEKGEALRRLHLMEPAAIGEVNYPFMGDAEDDEEDSVVASGHPKLKDARVYINKSQYFDGVPQVAWDFHIGGYQPAQKWLKDRKGRAISYADIGHYQSIVKILVETDRIMREIELPLETEDA
ncbi:N-6 DNA methylase [Qipengyuania sp. SS22]|uniref:type ISP restriction/modification enzyme n=1 Tax=Qipengyuania sp. SS22 TaxID=2979461 RepID=UPI0021E62321|nr:type ISP restriction/modification enzyme [Qipengyuania sp. SS22]UYH54665.1 N-6 DNA methylase [Qipengyuania sp. SS22]